MKAINSYEMGVYINNGGCIVANLFIFYYADGVDERKKTTTTTTFLL